MKTKILTFSVVFMASALSWAGACTTNATSLTRELDRKCSSKTGPECNTCVETTYTTLTRAVPVTCKEAGGEVLVAKENWLSQHCH